LITRQRLPYATLFLIAANIVAAFVLLWVPNLVNFYGFQSSNPSIKTAITSLFLHQNVLHLLGNMLFLAAVGPAVELGAGRWRFLTVYMLGGFAGVVVHWIFSQKIGITPPLIGASGCISACIAYYSLRYYHIKVNIAPSIAVPVYWIILIWVVLQIGGAFINLGSVQAGTAYWAHVGGFAMGIILSLTFGAPREAHKERSKNMIGEMDGRSPGAKLAAANHHLKSHPNDETALREKADALAKLNEPDEEAACILQLMTLNIEGMEEELLLRLDRINRLENIPSLKRTMLADRYKTSLPDLSRLLLLSVIRVMNDNQRPDALFALACLDCDEFPENAGTWLKDLFANYPLHPASDLARARGWNP
jgi:membrane associated rhomboid family serine protease